MVSASSKSNVAMPGSMDRKGIKLLKVRDLGTKRATFERCDFHWYFQIFSLIFTTF